MTRYMKKIMIISILVLLIFNYNVYARYNYIFEIEAFSLERDSSEISYVVKKSSSEYTNDDVVLEIETNKPIKPIEGFTMSEDNKKIQKTFSENEKRKIVLKDNSGNKKEIEYEVDNIDKIPPTIEGIEDGKTYTNNLQPIYNDNIGIKNIQIDKYGTSLKLNCYTEYYDTSQYKGIDVDKNNIYVWITSKPKNTNKYRYYLNNTLKLESDEDEYTFTNLTKGTEYTVKIEAINSSGEVIDAASKVIKTRYFGKLVANKERKNNNNFFAGFRTRNKICFNYRI